MKVCRIKQVNCPMMFKDLDKLNTRVKVKHMNKPAEEQRLVM